MPENQILLIAHRGNLSGKKKNLENSPKYIDTAIGKGFDVEIDIRKISDDIFLGHDFAQYKITIDWLNERRNSLWIHCKNFEAINFFSNISNELNFFFHKKDDVVLTSKGFLWTYPGKEISNKSISVLPESSGKNWLEYTTKSKIQPYGYCSDFVELF